MFNKFTPEVRWQNNQKTTILSVLNNNKGFALPLVIMVMVVLFILVMGIYPLIDANLRNSTQWSVRTKALYVAESGLNHALYYLIEENTIPPDHLSFQLTSEDNDSSSYNVEKSMLEVNEADNNNPISIELLSEGTYGNGKYVKERTVKLIVKRKVYSHINPDDESVSYSYGNWEVEQGTWSED